MSKGEDKIIDLLNASRIPFVREKTFTDLKHGKFRFDFYIRDAHGAECIIEYNGEQHYQFVGKFYKNQTEWRQAQGRDMRKISYCLAHNIALYIIPFWELDSIKCAADLFRPQYRALDRYKNFTDFQTYTARTAKSETLII